MGRESLYRSLLAKFVAGQQAVPARIAAALAAGRPDEAQRLAHTLKGVSAQIGAERVRELAEALEDALRDRARQHAGPGAIRTAGQAGPDPLAPLQRELGERLAALIASIRAGLGNDQTAPPARGPEDLSRWPAMRERLEALLSEDDTAAVELFEAGEALARAALGTRFEGIADAIRAFDLPTALTRLREAG
jgi:two-component system sensor histidine kinase/response regulator